MEGGRAGLLLNEEVCDNSNNDGGGEQSTSSTVGCCTRARVVVTADAVALSRVHSPCGIAWLGARAHETLLWRHVRLVTASVGARSVSRLLLYTVLSLACGALYAFFQSLRRYQSATVEGESFALVGVPVFLVLLCLWLLQRTASFGAFTLRADEVLAPLATDGFPVRPADGVAALRAAAAQWSVSRGWLRGAAGDLLEHQPAGAALIEAFTPLTVCGLMPMGSHKLFVRNSSDCSGGEGGGSHGNNGGDSNGGAPLAVLSRRAGCCNCKCTSAQSTDVFFLRDARYVTSSAGNAAFPGTPLGFVVALVMGACFGFGSVYFFAFFFYAPDWALFFAPYALFLVLSTLVQGTPMVFAFGAQLGAAAVYFLATNNAGAATLCGVVTCALLVLRLYLGMRAELGFGLLEAPPRTLRVPSTSVENLHAQSTGVAMDAPLDGGVRLVVSGAMASGRSVSVLVGEYTTTVRVVSGGCTFCVSSETLSARTRDLQFVHAAREGICAAVSRVVVLLLLGAALLYSGSFMWANVHVANTTAYVLFGVAALYFTYAMCTRKSIIILGTPFAKPMTLTAQLLDFLGALPLAARFAFHVSFSPATNGSRSAEAIANDITSVWMDACGGGLAPQHPWQGRSLELAARQRANAAPQKSLHHSDSGLNGGGSGFVAQPVQWQQSALYAPQPAFSSSGATLNGMVPPPPAFMGMAPLVRPPPVYSPPISHQFMTPQELSYGVVNTELPLQKAPNEPGQGSLTFKTPY